MKKLAVVIILSLFFACGTDGVETPEKLLSEDDMVNVMYDMALMQAINSTAATQLDSSKVDSKKYIYKKYSIDSLSLVKNFKYYAADIEQYQKMHKEVSERLKTQKAPLDSVAKQSSTKEQLKRKKEVISLVK